MSGAGVSASGAGENAEDQVVASERTRLLSISSQSSTYRTISRRSLGDIFLPPDEDIEADNNSELPKHTNPWGSLSILLLGVFVAQLDASLVLATYGHIASEFDELDSGSWLISAFIIAQCAVQPLYGKLSDIYSRKSCLLAAYVLFTIGTIGVGLSRSIWEVIAWRVIQGAGGAGMVSVVSIIITDIVPKHEVATMRSYVNVLQTMGRSCGGVIGGLLTQAIGWRWAFLIQAPPMIIAIGLVIHGLKLPSTGGTDSRWNKLKRVDFVGAFFLTLTILGLCLILDLGGLKLEWTSPWIIGFAVGSVSSFIIFIISTRFVREPIFPLTLFTQGVVITNYAVALLGATAQLSLMAFAPIYFQASAHASVAAAGLYLVPAFVGNTLGGLLSGYWIKRTGRYKSATVLGPILALICAILVLTWNGSSPAECLFIFPGGLSMGVLSSSTFVGLIAGLNDEHVAIAVSGMYLAFNIGAIGGISAGNVVSQKAIRSYLAIALLGYSDKQEIIQRTVSDLEYIWRVESMDLRNILIAAYTQGMHAVNYLGIGCALVALLFAVFSRGTRLRKEQPSASS